jgi:hypothetical protein
MSTSLTLYAVEETLQALLDTVDMVEDPEQQEAIARDIVLAHMAAVEKRDRVGQFLVHLESQQEAIDKEIARLRALKATYGKAQERVEAYVLQVVMAPGPDAKGKYRRLDGKTYSFGVRKNPASVNITDEAAVPAEFKSVTVTMPALVFEDLVGSLGIEERAAVLEQIKRAGCTASKSAIKEHIKATGEQVPGAVLVEDQYRLIEAGNEAVALVRK